jgi:hypothetical protein
MGHPAVRRGRPSFCRRTPPAACSSRCTRTRRTRFPGSPDRTRTCSYAEEPAASPHDVRSRWSDLGWHTALFAAAQLVLVLIGLSWLADLAASGDMGSFLASGGSSGTEGLGNFFYHAGKIWVIVFLVDVAWTALTGTRSRALMSRRYSLTA